MAFYKPGNSSSAPLHGRTEFEILKDSHRFLREDNDSDTWEDQLARKYYDSLFREYAVCDLKHYKSGNFALRWRTESEVISGAGETTCGNTRCALHAPRGPEEDEGRRGLMKTLELPFAYAERGENKRALVKVVLCDRCVGKLMWKRNKEKEKLGEGKEVVDQRTEEAGRDGTRSGREVEEAGGEAGVRVKEERTSEPPLSPRRHHRRREGDSSERRRSERSRSPRRRGERGSERRLRSH